MSFHIFFSNILSKTGFQIIQKKIYRKKYFSEEAKRLLMPYLMQYNDLTCQYPSKADLCKAEENKTLFLVMLHWLNLDKKKNCKILDIGGRAGLFAYYCRSYGHDAYVADLKEVLERSPNKELLQLFKVNSIPLKIKAFESLSLLEPLSVHENRFDLITGFRTRFHSTLPFETGKNFEEHWGVEEWDYFLRDISLNLLKEDGSIFFMLNRLQERERKNFVPKELVDFFRSKGGNLQQQYLFFPTTKKIL